MQGSLFKCEYTMPQLGFFLITGWEEPIIDLPKNAVGKGTNPKGIICHMREGTYGLNTQGREG